MINVNASDMHLFNFCLEQLFNTFVNIKESQNQWVSNIETIKFRVPIKLHFVQEGKKFAVPTKVGRFVFTRRELECLQCLIDGLSAKETGSRLFLSARTVETYLNNIKFKMECRTKRDIIRMVYIH